MTGLFVNDELKGIWKEAVATYVEILNQRLPKGM
jgi:hypothetical protein